MAHTLAALLSLIDTLDDTDSNGLPHVTDSEATKRRVLRVALNAHRFGRDKPGNASITRLHELRLRFHRLTGTTVHLLEQLLELAGYVGSVAVKNGSVAGTDLARVVEDDDLSGEGGSFLRRIVLGVRSNITATNILNRDVPDVRCKYEEDSESTHILT